MKTLHRNKKTIWYANPIGKGEPVRDENGLLTGDVAISYGKPKMMKISFSESIGLNNLPAQGVADIHDYGITTNYTHRMVTENMNCPIREDSIIWHGIKPGADAYEVPHNFKVIRVGEGLTQKMYYLRKVDVGHVAPYVPPVTGETGDTNG